MVEDQFKDIRSPEKAATNNVVVVGPTPLKLADYVFTPYQLPANVYSKVSDWMATDAEYQAPLWTTLIHEPTMPSKTYQPTFVPYSPRRHSPVGSEPSDVDSYSSGSSTRLSKTPSFDSNETKIVESVVSQSVEKVEAATPLGWEGYLDDELPPQTHGNILSRLRHSIFTLYRRLFGIVFIANMIIFVITVIRRDTSALHLGQIVIANFFVAILMRQDYVVNAFFNVFCAG